MTGLPAGETLQAGTVAGLPHDKLADRSSSATRDWVRFLWETEDAYWQTLLPLPEGRAEGAGSGDRHRRRLQHAEPDGQAGLHRQPCLLAAPRVPRPAVGFRELVCAERLDGQRPRRPAARPGLAPRVGQAVLYHRVRPPGAEHVLQRRAVCCAAAYAGLQDWDYLSTSRFAQRNDFPLRRIRHWFDIDQHPTKMITLIPAAAMFLRGDVAPAKQQVVATLDRQQELDLLPRQYPWSLVDLGPRGVPPEATLVHRVALAVEGQTVPPDALRPDQVKLPTTTSCPIPANWSGTCVAPVTAW